MKNSLASLKEHLGYYRGQGVNHEGEKFDGIFELTEISRGSGFQIKFQAKSIDSQAVFHSEVSTLSPTLSGEIALFNLNSNTPFMAEHKLITNETKDNRLQLKFRFGNIEDKSSFREEIFLEAFNKTISYQYSWGLPGGDFAERSKVILSLVEVDPIDLAYNLFSQVGGSAALMELEMRLLANKVKEIEEASFAWSVSKTEDAVIKHFTKEALLTDEEGKLLITARDVRNKFLHGEFNTAISLVEEYFKQKSGVKPVDMIKFDQTSDVSILDQLLSHINGEKKPTAIDSTTLKEGGLFGWFLQAFQSGSLGLALNLMSSALAIIQRISADHAKHN